MLVGNVFPNARLRVQNFVQESFSYSDVYTVKYAHKPSKKPITSYLSSLLKKNKTIKLVSDKQNEFLKKDLNLNLHIKNGETFGVGNNLLVNNNGRFECLNMTAERYSKLFPPKSSNQATQSRRTGDCWLVSTLNGLMRKPKGKIGILRTLGQNFEDLYVKLPSMSVFFKYSQPVKSQHDVVLKGTPGLQLLEEAVAMKRLKTISNDTHHVSQVLGTDTIMYALNKGTQIEALHQFFPKLKPKVIDKNKKVQKRILENLSNNDNTFVGISTEANEANHKEKFGGVLIPRHSFSVNSYDKKTKQVELQDPYKPENPIFMNIDELMKYPFCLVYTKLK